MRHRAVVLVAALLASTACGALPAGAGSTPAVLASTTILADLVRNVAGPGVRVESIAPPGVEVEEYDPRPEDARRAADAKVVFVNGLDLDSWAEKLLQGSRATVVTLSEGLPAIADNPHLWYDPQLAKRYVEKIRDALSAFDPAGTAGYAERAAAYAAKLDALDAELKSKVAVVPPARRVLITSHDAYPYLARAYGFTIVGFIQAEGGKDPSPAELATLVAEARRANVPAVFAEAGSSDRLAQALAREAGIRTVVTDLPPDSLGAAPLDSYIGLMRVIIDTMVAALK